MNQNSSYIGDTYTKPLSMRMRLYPDETVPMACGLKAYRAPQAGFMSSVIIARMSELLRVDYVQNQNRTTLIDYDLSVAKPHASVIREDYYVFDFPTVILAQRNDAIIHITTDSPEVWYEWIEMPIDFRDLPQGAPLFAYYNAKWNCITGQLMG